MVGCRPNHDSRIDAQLQMKRTLATILFSLVPSQDFHTLTKDHQTLLILPASFNRSPVVWVFRVRSLPAKSTTLNRLTWACATAEVTSDEARPAGTRTTLMVKTLWEGKRFD